MKKESQHTTPGFSVPDGYFESLEERLATRVSEEHFPCDAGFVTPEGYFEALEERVYTNAFPKKRTSVVRLHFQQNWTRYAAVAAVLIGVLAFWSINNSSVTAVDSIEFSSIAQYLEEGYVSWDTEDITALTNTETWEDVEWDASHVSEEHIESYLLDHIEPNTLINE
ncbi:hypothetical protein [Altibacter sp. HG106]|uniref:hypothetical protein n=1 Tax=Altibacter sp. HG106 TaxID=3023937 RepID=UPI00234FC09E|nr:hypothetical protein [Altibacter sp. HG106]MDC7993777.1 hypothetical protein [Altibacter sp. HG106]